MYEGGEYGNKAFNNIAAAMFDREDEILNYFVHRSTNAAAESLNAKIKQFRAQLRDIIDRKFFLFRLFMHSHTLMQVIPMEPLLKNIDRPYRSAIIMQNWKIIYRYDESDNLIIIVDFGDMRMNPKTLVNYFIL